MPDGNSSDIVEKGIKEHCSYTCKGADCFVYLYLYAALGGACRNTENGSTALFLCHELNCIGNTGNYETDCWKIVVVENFSLITEYDEDICFVADSQL